MDQDVDMDAPQISTLREEASPPPLKAKRIKLVIKDKPTASTVPPASRHHQQQQQQPHSTNAEEDGEEEEDDQEDQLIDDDEPIPPSGLPPPRPVEVTSKRKSPAKRKPRKSDKRPPEEGRFREKVMQQPGAPNLAPTMLWFEANPSEPHGAGQASDHGQITMLGPDPPLSMKITGKKKVVSKKTVAPKKPKTSVASSSSATKPPKIKLLPPPMPEDSGIISEGMTGTAASSPAVDQFEDFDHTPEPDNLVPVLPVTQNLIPEEINLEGIPIPVYPLPTKPFPVLPPPKVGSGFASNMALDRSGTKVRHWRTAKREIRGIAGGRWFAKAWVGEKESVFANQMENQAELRKLVGESSPSHVAMPKLPSVSAPTGKGKGKGKGASSISTSAAPSRSESQVPDTVLRAPTKMRILQMAMPIPPSSEAGDSDLMGPPGS